MAPARGGVSLPRLLPILLLALAASLGEQEQEQQPAEQPQPAAAQPGAELVEGNIGDVVRPAVEEPAAPTSGPGGAEFVVAGDSEPEGEEGDEQEKHGEGEGEASHHHVSKVEFTVAFLVFGFLVFNMILLCCMNYPDPDMRSNVRGMISSTISIFSAVPFNQAVLSLTVEQLMSAPRPRGLGIAVTPSRRVIVGVLLFIFFWTILNQFGRCVRYCKDANIKYATKMISGHITAFAGIFVCDNLSTGEGALGDSVPVALASVIVPAVAVGSLLLALFLSRLWRYSTFEDDEDGSQEGGEQWEEDVEEAEMDAAALIWSYVVQMILLRVITGRPVAFKEQAQMHRKEVFWMLMAGAGFLALVVGSVFFKRITQSTHQWAKMGQTCFSMCMSWCFLRVSEQWMFNQFKQSPSVAQCCNALTMTCLSLCAIRLLDCVADDIREGRRRAFEAEVQEHIQHHGGSEGLGFRAETGDLAWEASLRTKTNDLLMHQEKALRRVIDGFGLLVGLSWERAFDMCAEKLIEGKPYTRAHAVIAKIMLAALVLCVVVPAWIWYIVPTARLTRKEHDLLMQKEKQTASLFRYDFGRHLPEGANRWKCGGPCSDSDATDEPWCEDTEDQYGFPANGARPGADPQQFNVDVRAVRVGGMQGSPTYWPPPGGPMMAAGPGGMAVAPTH